MQLIAWTPKRYRTTVCLWLYHACISAQIKCTYKHSTRPICRSEKQFSRNKIFTLNEIITPVNLS